MAKKPEPEAPASGRAAKLHKKIKGLADAPQGEASAPNEKQPLSPRDFINKRMAELDKKKGG